MPYASALRWGRAVHFCREATSTPELSTFLCPRCTNKSGLYMVTSRMEDVTCKLCMKWMRAVEGVACGVREAAPGIDPA